LVSFLIFNSIVSLCPPLINKPLSSLQSTNFQHESISFAINFTALPQFILFVPSNALGSISPIPAILTSKSNFNVSR
jgi:hypothetical protein